MDCHLLNNIYSPVTKFLRHCVPFSEASKSVRWHLPPLRACSGEQEQAGLCPETRRCHEKRVFLLPEQKGRYNKPFPNRYYFFWFYVWHRKNITHSYLLITFDIVWWSTKIIGWPKNASFPHVLFCRAKPHRWYTRSRSYINSVGAAVLKRCFGVFFQEPSGGGVKEVLQIVCWFWIYVLNFQLSFVIITGNGQA